MGLALLLLLETAQTCSFFGETISHNETRDKDQSLLLRCGGPATWKNVDHRLLPEQLAIPHLRKYRT